MNKLINKTLSYGVLVSLLFMGSGLYAATIKGNVKVEGQVPANPVIRMDADPVCKAMHSEEVYAEKVIVDENQNLKNAFIYVKEGLKGDFKVPDAAVTLDQKGCRYDPHVLGVQINQKMKIFNSDATLHNVHALGKNNPEFNLGMPLQNMKLEKTFSNPEVMMKFKCDVHPWMSAYIAVLEHPFFAVSDENGNFEISGLPSGEYVLEIWHETYGTQEKKIKVSDSEEVNFVYSSKSIEDEASGVSIKTSAPRHIERYDDSKALDLPRKKTGWWLPENISTYGKRIDHIFNIILVLTTIVFFGVQGFLIIFIWKYRGKKDKKAHYTHGSNKAEIIWTAIPAMILVFLAFYGQGVWDEVKVKVPVGQDVVRIRVLAEQFAWNIQYPGKDGKFDTEDDFTTVNQLHMPVGKPVKATLVALEKEDKPAVLHSFFLPEFRLKQDVVPGMEIDVWFEATRTGRYEIACAEFCGIGHYRMKGFLNIHSQEGFDHWLEEQAILNS